MEFNGIPMGHICNPTYSTPITTHSEIKSTSLKGLDEFMSSTKIEKPIDYTDLENIDDTMDIDLAHIGLIEVDIPKVPDGYEPSDYDVIKSLQKSIQLSETYLKVLEGE